MVSYTQKKGLEKLEQSYSGVGYSYSDNKQIIKLRIWDYITIDNRIKVIKDIQYYGFFILDISYNISKEDYNTGYLQITIEGY